MLFLNEETQDKIRSSVWQDCSSCNVSTVLHTHKHAKLLCELMVGNSRFKNVVNQKQNEEGRVMFTLHDPKDVHITKAGKSVSVCVCLRHENKKLSICN